MKYYYQKRWFNNKWQLLKCLFGFDHLYRWECGQKTCVFCRYITNKVYKK